MVPVFDFSINKMETGATPFVFLSAHQKFLHGQSTGPSPRGPKPASLEKPKGPSFAPIFSLKFWNFLNQTEYEPSRIWPLRILIFENHTLKAPPPPKRKRFLQCGGGSLASAAPSTSRAPMLSSSPNADLQKRLLAQQLQNHQQEFVNLQKFSSLLDAAKQVMDHAIPVLQKMDAFYAHQLAPYVSGGHMWVIVLCVPNLILQVKRNKKFFCLKTWILGFKLKFCEASTSIV